eukprot:830297-Pyramimonas_sp.AAC.1
MVHRATTPTGQLQRGVALAREAGAMAAPRFPGPDGAATCVLIRPFAPVGTAQDLRGYHGCGARGVARARAYGCCAAAVDSIEHYLYMAPGVVDGNVGALDKKLRATACPAACWVSV